MSGRRRAGATPPAGTPVLPGASDGAGRKRRAGGLRTIRARIAVILAVPTLLLVVLAAVGVFGQLGVARDAEATAGNVELVLSAQELVHSLQRERGLSVGLVGGETGYRDQLDQVRTASDTARASLDALLVGTGSADAVRIRAALATSERLAPTRSAVDAGQTTKAEVFAFYTDAISALDGAAFAGGVGQDDPRLRAGLAALRALSAGKEATAQERGSMNGVFATGFFSKGEYTLVAEIRAARIAAFAEFVRVAEPAWAQAFSAAQRSPQATTMLALEQRALANPTAKRLNVTPENWWNAATVFIDGLHEVQRTVADAIRDRATEVKSEARTTLFLYAGGAAVMLLAASGLGLMTFRSIIRPLRMLTAEAHDAAERRLPGAVAEIQAADDPGGVVLDHTTSTLARRDDEFAEVAAALDNLQETAVRLAVEQAVMRRNTAESLANLGRRNQNLVRRQLGFISALEKEETDPNQLANLFELDHLATRMRRNAESLLVLVGEHSPRRWSGSIPVGDILRSAFAEVEDYRRVVLRRVDDGLVRGTVAAEISHLLAELVENALSFSPPDHEVEVSARATGTEYHIAIVDQGIGMTPDALAEANARLRGQQSFLMQPTRDLGHYVVGRLAARLGVRVWLHESPLNGVTARIVLPGAMLTAPEARPEPEPALVGAAPPVDRAVAGRFAPPSAAPAGRTAGGLAKRPPRSPGGHRRTPPEPSAAPPPAADRTPGEVKSMLDSFRAGYQRAEHQRDTDQRDTGHQGRTDP
ncbi:nitrate- and nitrite sensing domain-containing protein [Actinocorallia sp. API 0066]|uniref:sensor histidine kinase n=1 Tax=Actinocorallia sp. API 0066 TaxID=2896846 RepID=UPI001E2DAB98|nr:nitrate- and nitrite sensing domain-containing protein [Actinocorallia sp. API 0066]MCD0448537.1 nitrate- and nitrite sensing domain-containing protein [Actinocorallia sp. API 0066]